MSESRKGVLAYERLFDFTDELYGLGDYAANLYDRLSHLKTINEDIESATKGIKEALGGSVAREVRFLNNRHENFTEYIHPLDRILASLCGFIEGIRGVKEPVPAGYFESFFRDHIADMNRSIGTFKEYERYVSKDLRYIGNTILEEFIYKGIRRMKTALENYSEVIDASKDPIEELKKTLLIIRGRYIVKDYEVYQIDGPDNEIRMGSVSAQQRGARETLMTLDKHTNCIEEIYRRFAFFNESIKKVVEFLTKGIDEFYEITLSYVKNDMKSIKEKISLLEKARDRYDAFIDGEESLTIEAYESFLKKEVEELRSVIRCFKNMNHDISYNIYCIDRDIKKMLSFVDECVVKINDSFLQELNSLEDEMKIFKKYIR